MGGLYAVTPDGADTPGLVAAVEAALAGGASALQYRNKSASRRLQAEQAAALAQVCRRFGVPLIINDHLDLAIEVDAAGVHLGEEDGPLAQARERLGSTKILGASCYTRLDSARRAQAAGADYVAFGSFFPSSVKPDAPRASLSLLREARRHLAVPVVAIGGITLQNAPDLIAAGAHGVAVITAVFGAPDIQAAARGFRLLFKASEHAAQP